MDKETQQQNVESLKKALEAAAEIRFDTPKQFEKLRQFIFNRTGDYISRTTLMRIWGYVDEPLNTRVSTFSLLARTVGYKDWEDFINRRDSASNDTISSSYKFGRSINVISDLTPGQTIILYWDPGRECKVRYLGEMRFEVIESRNTRLLPGDTFYCNLIIPGHPLHLSGVKRDKLKPAPYICGLRRGGIQYEILEEGAPV